MKKSKQQIDALEYFQKHAHEWAVKAKGKSLEKFNLIKERNDYVLNRLKNLKKKDLTLDIGCGTGDLVIEIAKKNIHSIGVDFAEDMIKIAKKNALKNNAHLAEFICQSIFEYDFEKHEYDLISANGFIEYISIEELNLLLELCHNGLKSGGSLVLGSRNRLFNVFSMNEFTEVEIAQNSINALILESIAWINGIKIEDIINMESLPLENLKQEQKITNINISMRYQFTPLQLIKLLKEKGFKVVHIYPIHIHGVVPKFKDLYPAVHKNIALLLQQYAIENINLLPNASTFIIHAIKEDFQPKSGKNSEIFG
ncbi:MAG: class I SAM-dependent methyltransferase [Promethearchaeota archaeon]